jgi:hypothetical protein
MSVPAGSDILLHPKLRRRPKQECTPSRSCANSVAVVPTADGNRNPVVMLSVIGVLIAAAFLVGGIVCWRRAPAVTAACAGGLSVGGWAVYVVVRHGGPDAPVTVALAVSGGFGLAGLVGLLATPRGDARSLRAAGIKVLVAAPAVAAALAASLETACPMYDESPSAGVCQYSVDVLGGWLGPTGVLAGLDVVIIGLLLLVSARLAAFGAR